MSLEHAPVRQGRGRLLCPSDAAEYLNVAKQTLAHWRCAGTGPTFVKVGRRAIAYFEHDLADYATERRRTSTSEPDQ